VATYRITSWRGIPASVEAQDGQGAVTRPLSERFQMLIDSAAMQLGLEGTDAYLEQWEAGPALERTGGAAEVAEAVAAELEDRFAQFVAGAFRRA
jgi:hypothetical protein